MHWEGQKPHWSKKPQQCNNFFFPEIVFVFQKLHKHSSLKVIIWDFWRQIGMRHQNVEDKAFHIVNYYMKYLKAQNSIYLWSIFHICYFIHYYIHFCLSISIYMWVGVYVQAKVLCSQNAFLTPLLKRFTFMWTLVVNYD